MIPSSLDSPNLRFTPISKAACRQKETPMNITLRRAGVAGCLLVVLVLLLIPISQYAATSAPPGVLEACINPGNGGMRLVDSSQACHNNETRISWNVTGPPGPVGPAVLTNRCNRSDRPGRSYRRDRRHRATGATGPAGPAGPAGPSILCWTTVRMDLHAGPSSERRHRFPTVSVCL